MTGTVTSYTPSTQSLVCNMTSIGGGGTFTSWRIGYRGPRFDHDSAGVCRGLLIEEGRTNLVTQSGNASSWPNSLGTVTNNGSTTAPDGSSAGYLAGIGTANLMTYQTASVTGSYVATLFLKRNNTDWVRMQFIQGYNINAANFWINLATGAAGTLSVGVGTPTLTSAQVTPFGNGWYRCSIAVSFPATDFLNFAVISASANNSVTRVSGSVYEVWGGQIEAGSFPTSYIPTTTGTLARSADVCSITGGDFNNFYNSTAGTLLSEAMIANLVGDNRGNVQIDDGTNLQLIRHVYSSLTGGFDTTIVGNGTTTRIAVTAGTASVIQKRITAYQGTSFAAVTNGGAVATATRTMPLGLNAIRIGNLVGGSFYLNGHIAAVRFYKKRLPNAKIQALTV
jgi:hypothetical protein